MADPTPASPPRNLLDDPPDEPPPETVQPMLWRVGVYLVKAHHPRHLSRGGPTTCSGCGQLWPCFPRRLGQRALHAALTPINQPHNPGSAAASEPPHTST